MIRAMVAFVRTILVRLKGLRLPAGRTAGPGRQEGRMDLSLALGIPIVLGLLMGFWAWPVSWTGAPIEVMAPAPAAVAAGAGGAEEPSGAGGSRGGEAIPSEAERGEMDTEARTLRESLSQAEQALRETAATLAGLRARQESEVEAMRQERDRMALGMAELRVELAAVREAQVREVKRMEGRVREMEEQIGKREREMGWLQAARWDERGRAAMLEELRRVREAEQRGGAGSGPATPGGGDYEDQEAELRALRGLYLEAQRRLARAVREASLRGETP